MALRIRSSPSHSTSDRMGRSHRRVSCGWLTLPVDDCSHAYSLQQRMRRRYAPDSLLTRMAPYATRVSRRGLIRLGSASPRPRVVAEARSNAQRILTNSQLGDFPPSHSALLRHSFACRRRSSSRSFTPTEELLDETRPHSNHRIAWHRCCTRSRMQYRSTTVGRQRHSTAFSWGSHEPFE